MRNKLKFGNGFTLIEIMITVAIIGVLSAIAIPIYNDYTIRTKVVAGINLVNSIKTGVSESYSTDDEAGVIAFKDKLAVDSALGTVVADRVVSVEVSNDAGQLGTITVTFNSDLIPPLGTENILKLSPHINGQSLDNSVDTGTIRWECSGASGTNAIANFPGTQLGTIKSKYLPNVCR